MRMPSTFREDGASRRTSASNPHAQANARHILPPSERPAPAGKPPHAAIAPAKLRPSSPVASIPRDPARRIYPCPLFYRAVAERALQKVALRAAASPTNKKQKPSLADRELGHIAANYEAASDANATRARVTGVRSLCLRRWGARCPLVASGLSLTSKRLSAPREATPLPWR